MSDETERQEQKKRENNRAFMGMYLGISIASFFGGQFIKYYKNQRIDTAIAPVTVDVNSDGIDDIVLRRNDGSEFVLYGTPRGDYVFGEERK